MCISHAKNRLLYISSGIFSFLCAGVGRLSHSEGIDSFKTVNSTLFIIKIIRPLIRY